MISLARRVYPSILIGCTLLSIISKIANSSVHRSVLIEDDDIVLFEIMKDGSIKNWGPRRPGEVVHIPDGVGLKLRNESNDEPMTLVEKNSPDLPINIEHKESITVVQSETGDIGYEKTSADGEIKLITSTQNYNKLYPDDNQQKTVQDSASNTNQASTNKEQSEKKKPYSYMRTITKISPKEESTTDWGGTLNEPIVTQPTCWSQRNNWWAAPLTGITIFSTAMIGLYYLSKMARECARYLATESLWSSWKSDEPYDVILMMQPRCLAKDLIRDIKATYYGEANPVKLFLEDIKQEYETILQWIQFRNTLRNFRLNLGGEFDTMENKLMLLEHMRKTVYWWRSQELSKE